MSERPGYAGDVDLETFGPYRTTRAPSDPRPLYRFSCCNAVTHRAEQSAVSA